MNERDKTLYRQATQKEWAYDFDIYTAEKFADLIRADEREQRLWVGLTQDEVLTIGRQLGLKCRLGGNANIDFDYADAIEAKLKAVNGFHSTEKTHD